MTAPGEVLRLKESSAAGSAATRAERPVAWVGSGATCSAVLRPARLYDRRVPPDASATRKRLLDAAAREFAEHGVWNASLIEVTRRAGQRNRAALRYHFGSREAVLCAVLERHVEFLAQREGELLAKALETAADDVGAVVEAIVRPAAELAASGLAWTRSACSSSPSSPGRIPPG